MDSTAASDAASDPSTALTVEVAQKSDVGLVRSENQDFAIINTAEEQAVTPDRGRLMVVADGMGGHRGGATASRMAATIIKTEYLASGKGEPGAALKAALESANAKVYAEAQVNPELRGMGTTCSGLVILGSTAYVAHVGDSRIYMMRAGEIRQITDDHSLVASMVREGLLSAKEAETHPRRNVLQRSMGVSEQVEVDTLTFPVEPGDTFILCSDGLHGLVKKDEMGEVAVLEPQVAVAEFVKRVLERGAPDNVTVIIARVGPQESVQVAGAEGIALAPVPELKADTPVTEPAGPQKASEGTSKVPAAVSKASVGRPILKWVFMILLAIGVGAALYLCSDGPMNPPSQQRGRPAR